MEVDLSGSSGPFRISGRNLRRRVPANGFVDRYRSFDSRWTGRERPFLSARSRRVTCCVHVLEWVADPGINYRETCVRVSV